MSTLTFRKILGQELAPFNEETAQWIETKIKNGEVFEVKKPKKIRNPRFHRRFFQMLNYAFRNLPEYLNFPNLESFRKSVIISSGYFEPVQTFIYNQETKKQDLVEIRQAKSMSFSSMDEREFRELYNSVHATLCSVYGFHDDEYFVINLM